MALRAAVMTLAFTGAHAGAQTISAVGDLGSISQMPGSATNFDLFGSSSILTDFTDGIAPAATGPLGPVTSSILPPGENTAVSTYVNWRGDYSGPVNIETFTLSDVGPTSFNYADFNVYVMYSNFDNAVWREASISLAAGTDATGLGATVIPVSDTNTDSSMARVVEFNITGAAAGETFTLAATPTAAAVVAANGNPAGADLGGISFESAPEPMTCAMMLGGLALLGFCARREWVRA